MKKENMTSRFGRCVMLCVRFITPNYTWFVHHLFRSGTSSVSPRSGWLCSLWPLAAWLSLWGMGVRCLHPTARVPLLPRQCGDCDCGAHRLSLPSSLRQVYIFLSSDAVRPDQEAHSSATSGPAESMLLAHSSSKGTRCDGVEADVTSESTSSPAPAYEDLLLCHDLCHCQTFILEQRGSV